MKYTKWLLVLVFSFFFHIQLWMLNHFFPFFRFDKNAVTILTNTYIWSWCVSLIYQSQASMKHKIDTETHHFVFSLFFSLVKVERRTSGKTQLLSFKSRTLSENNFQLLLRKKEKFFFLSSGFLSVFNGETFGGKVLRIFLNFPPGKTQNLRNYSLIQAISKTSSFRWGKFTIELIFVSIFIRI